MLKLLYALGATLLLSACATSPHISTESFHSLAADHRIRYEAGAANAAGQVAALLPAAIQQVEAAHGRAFLGEVTVHVCGSVDCFKRHVRTPNASAATVPDNRVFLAPQLFGREAHRLSAILTHELSHLHLGQQIGHYTSTVPAWFHEGLAAFAANGGGADYASDEQTITTLRQGKGFEPDRRDTPIKRHTADYWGMDVFVFYRQAFLFVNFLRQESATRFQDFLQAVQDNQDFDLAFGNAYNRPLKEAGERFRQSHSVQSLALNP
ncbi:MAG: hypothetical protein Q8L39_13385 [Burkholderiales bacterium]|nr:hypothetical protein [Burkholderiales bacterium]